MRVFISTAPFGENDRDPLDLLEESGLDYLINPYGRKLKEEELAELVGDFDVLIAGTEPIKQAVLSKADKLKLIARVGIGLDSIDLLSARDHDISVTYTPDAPSAAVAELTIGLMLSLLRSIHLSNSELHRCEWRRYIGRRLSECTIGIIGAGRIGSRVIEHLSSFDCKRVMVNDLDESRRLSPNVSWEWQDKETIYRESDVISIHVPLTALTRNMISNVELRMMRPDALLLNTARGGIVNEAALYEVMKKDHLSGAAVDAFEYEPYAGPLGSIDRCLLTAHMGSMSEDCRIRMEMEATREAVRFAKGEELAQEVPEEEYENQRFVFGQRENSDG